ncbi:MAG: esterase-like activity of phytase family protein [Rhizobiales bacterium]|nr:esterase-like activity of phytase family protein [Hyphomicrobiales bacterium]
MIFNRRRLLACGALFAAALVAGSFALAEALRYSPAPTRIAIQATPIAAFDNRDPAQTRFGLLEFRGGLALTSNDKAFGGISGIHVEPDGSHFLAVTDNGSWLRGRIVYDEGKPVGVADAEMAPILGADGKPLAARGWHDVESLTKRDGKLYIGIERVEQIVRFDVRRDGLKARGGPIAVPPDFKTFTKNKSLECLAAPPKGAPLAGKLIVVAEESLDAAGNHRSFLIDGDRVERFSVKRSDDFDVTDCTVLPPGDLLLLERRFSPARGVAMRIRRVPLAGIKAGALVDGAPLIVADLAYQIDNMEGIAVHRNARGETVLTLVSDDNFSVIQRNLLLQFTLVGE